MNHVVELARATSTVPSHPSDHACIDLVNSFFRDYLGGGSTDRIGAAEWQQWFLDRHGLTPDTGARAPVDDLSVLRRDLRRILEKWAALRPLSSRDLRSLDARIREASLRHRVVRAGDVLELREEPLRRDWTWVMASVAASAVELMSSGDPRRLKTCSNPDCSWVFYDSTVNRSKRYCSTTPCGSLVRVRRFRRQR